jgi:iron complex transport system substrate-binding protein
MVLLAAVLVGCRGDAAHTRAADASAGITLTDDNAHEVHLARPAQRVLSLIPSANETLIALGAAPLIVGRTRYDVAPEIAGMPSVGGGLDPNVEEIVALKPDLVVAWESDKRQTIRAKLLALGIPTFSLRTQDTTDVFRSIANLGKLVGKDSAARALTDGIHAQLTDVKESVKNLPKTSAFYVVYNDPPMTASPITFIGQLISVAGGTSLFVDSLPLWRTVSMEEIVKRNPDVIILPTGEFKSNSAALMKQRPGWRDVGAVKKGHVVTVTADLLSRPGARIGDAAKVLRAALHSEFAADTSIGRTTPAKP